MHRLVNRLAVLAALCAGAAARADSVAVAFADPGSFSGATQLALMRAAEEALRERSGLQVLEQARPIAGSPRRRCGEEPQCARALAATTKADYALLLSLGQGGASGVTVEGVWLDVHGTRAVQRKVKGVALDAAQGPLRELVDALVPPYLRKGYGGLVVDTEPGFRVKVDGRMVPSPPSGEPFAVMAGTHEVDVVWPSGQAVLERVAVAEGGRKELKLEVGRDAVALTPAPRVSGMRVAAYGTFSGGAVSVAGAFVLAGLSRAGANRVQSCEVNPALCSDIAEANREKAQAQQLASTANILLGVGAGLAAVGAGLFAWDLVSTR